MQSASDLIAKWNSGDSNALDELIFLTYFNLHSAARYALGIYRDTHSIQATELVSELYCHLKLQNCSKDMTVESFVSIAAFKIRQLLQERFRSKKRLKRDGGDREFAVNIEETPSHENLLETLAVTEVLDNLRSIDSKAALLTELKVFWGLSNKEAAEVLGLSERSANRLWRWAKAWLLQVYSDT